MNLCIRFTSNVFKEDASSEVLIEVEESVLRGLYQEGYTRPC